ncbi:uracil-DNA glycosylase [Acaromyces ingoldii]|uniref:Uracil-DNA glycosylase n=1 Tax=Acaromyces ingoldii TaxID=215250 RepID=A0A316YK78_9BASI|nr:uracil-DNA glycosylase [Acaromyces ingoldii]PWN89960.1 uracil-DNA glycosylase [Acaromyces ingoldii]
MASTSAPKRPLSPSVSQASSAPSPSAKRIREASVTGPDDIDGVLDGVDGFDDEALIEAASEIEEAASSSPANSQSQQSQPRSKATSTAGTLARAPTKTSSASSFGTQINGDALLEAASEVEEEASRSPLSHGDEAVERQTMDKEWFDRMEGETKKPYFKQLKTFLAGERASGKTIYPPAHLIHSWSRLTPLHTVKVVVVGQDPYHGPKQACGHSFSVQKGVAVPASLKNIYKELSTEYGDQFQQPKHGCLDGWAKQGVLLLNACLTVQAGQAASHHGKGWEPFTKAVLKIIADEASKGATAKNSKLASMFSKQQQQQQSPPQKDKKASDEQGGTKGVVFLAWGLPAAKSLAEAGITDKTPNVLILRSAHPSPLSAHRGFLGNGHFKKANDWLQERYGPGGGIDWGKL